MVEEAVVGRARMRRRQWKSWLGVVVVTRRPQAGRWVMVETLVERWRVEGGREAAMAWARDWVPVGGRGLVGGVGEKGGGGLALADAEVLGSGGGAGGHGFETAAASDEVDHVQTADGGGVDAEKGLGEEVGGVVGRLEVFGVVDACQGLDVALVKGGGAVEAQPACVVV